MCFKFNKTIYDCDATVLLNVYCYLVFVGEGFLTLLPSHLPHLRQLYLVGCNMYREYAEEIMAALPGVDVFK